MSRQLSMAFQSNYYMIYAQYILRCLTSTFFVSIFAYGSQFLKGNCYG